MIKQGDNAMIGDYLDFILKIYSRMIKQGDIAKQTIVSGGLPIITLSVSQ